MSPTVVIADDDGDIRRLVAISARRANLEVVADVADGDAARQEGVVFDDQDAHGTQATVPGLGIA